MSFMDEKGQTEGWYDTRGCQGQGLVEMEVDDVLLEQPKEEEAETTCQTSKLATSW